MPEKFSKTSSPSPAPCRLALQLLVLSLVFGTAALIGSPAVAQEASAGKRYTSPTPDGGHKDVYTDGKGKVVRTDYFEPGDRYGSDRLTRSEEITSFNPDGSAAVKRTVSYDWRGNKRTSETVTQDEKGNAKSTRYCFYPIGANEAYAKYDPKTGWEFRDPKTGDWVALPDSKVGEKKPARYTPGKGWELYDPKTKEWLPTSEFGEKEPEARYTPGKGWEEWNQKKFDWVPIAKSAFDALNPKSGAGGSTATTTPAGTSKLKSDAEAPVDQCDPLGVRWEEGEAEGWRGIWIRRGNTNEFDATFSKGGASGKRLLTISIQGKNVTVKRSEDPGTGVTYTYTGTLQADGKTVRGTYVNSLGQGPAAWWAEIKCK